MFVEQLKTQQETKLKLSRKEEFWGEAEEEEKVVAQEVPTHEQQTEDITIDAYLV